MSSRPIFLAAAATLLALSPALRAQSSVAEPPSALPTPAAPGAPPREGTTATPNTPAMSFARQLNEAFVTVFDRVAPAVVVIDVRKSARPSVGNRGTPGGQNPFEEFFGDFFFRNRPDGSGSDDNSDDDSATPRGTPRRNQPAPTPSPRSQPGPRQGPKAEGSGFIVRPDGFLLTNNHVVEGGEEITVRLKDGRSFPAKVVGTDPGSDIAVLKIEGAGFPVAVLADSDKVRVGEIVFAIGAPYELDYTFTMGVVSAKARGNLRAANYEDYIQTDASINPGNSGGPLVNLDGQVVGMNTLINGINRGLGFAIPASMLRGLGDQLIEGGRVVRPYLGIRIQTFNDSELRENPRFSGVKDGVLVTSIDADTPASRSELKPSDVIVEVDGKPVRTDRELQKAVLLRKVGEAVQLKVFRRGEYVTVSVTSAELPDPNRTARANPRRPAQKKQGAYPPQEKPLFYGMEIQPLSKDMAANLGIREEKGVVVTSVTDGSPAAEAQVRAKDVITEVNEKPVTDVASFRAALKDADPKRGVLLYVARRGGGKTFVVIKDAGAPAPADGGNNDTKKDKSR